MSTQNIFIKRNKLRVIPFLIVDIDNISMQILNIIYKDFVFSLYLMINRSLLV